MYTLRPDRKGDSVNAENIGESKAFLGNPEAATEVTEEEEAVEAVDQDGEIDCRLVVRTGGSTTASSCSSSGSSQWRTAISGESFETFLGRPDHQASGVHSTVSDSWRGDKNVPDAREHGRQMQGMAFEVT